MIVQDKQDHVFATLHYILLDLTDFPPYKKNKTNQQTILLELNT